MLVTQKNLYAFYQDIKLHLPKAEYFSFDFEMTGIRTDDPDLISHAPEEKFYNYRSAANKYQAIQMGICLFTRKSEKLLEARPYNIFIFPRYQSGYSNEIVFDVSATDFNTKNGMDWNILFNDGVIYVPLKEAQPTIEEVMESFETDVQIDEKILKLNKDTDIEKSQIFQTDLKNWLTSDNQEPFVYSENSKNFRKYITTFLKKKYPHLVYNITPRPHKPLERDIYIYKVANVIERQTLMAKLKEEMEKKLLEIVGFSLIFDLLAHSKKVMVGHNCYFDLYFLYSHFIEPIPPNYQTFKTRLFDFFPEIYDTKFITVNTEIKNKIKGSSALGPLMRLVINNEDKKFSDLEIKLAEGFQGYSFNGADNGRFHEAGFDAFATGVVFAKSFYDLEHKDKTKVTNSIYVWNSLFNFKNGALKGYEPANENVKDLYVAHFVKYNKEELEAQEESKISIDDIRIKMEELPFKHIVQSKFVNTDKFKGIMLLISSTKEEERKVFTDKVFELKGRGFEVLTFEEYAFGKKKIKPEKKKVSTIEDKTVNKEEVSEKSNN